MQRTFQRALLCCAASALLTGVDAAERPCAVMKQSIENPTPALTDATFEELFALCRPKPSSEAWSEVAWIGEFWEGRQLAARVGKPMFIFAMNGHPLGCV